MAYVAIARSLIAWAHTIVERTATLVVLVGQQRLDQLCFVLGTGDLERSDSAMSAQAGSLFGR